MRLEHLIESIDEIIDCIDYELNNYVHTRAHSLSESVRRVRKSGAAATRVLRVCGGVPPVPGCRRSLSLSRLSKLKTRFKF